MTTHLALLNLFKSTTGKTIYTPNEHIAAEPWQQSRVNEYAFMEKEK